MPEGARLPEVKMPVGLLPVPNGGKMPVPEGATPVPDGKTPVGLPDGKIPVGLPDGVTPVPVGGK